jgi:hypothetical protein
MKRLTIILLSFFTAISLATHAQEPIHWQYKAIPAGANSYKIHITATIDDGWHAYSQTQPRSAVAQPTEINFKTNPLVKLKGKTLEAGKLIKWSDPASGISADQYEQQVDFVQSVGLKGKAKTALTGSLTFQACTDKMCLPPKTVPFSIAIP